MRCKQEYDITVTKTGSFTVMAYDLADAQARVAAMEEDGDLDRYVSDWNDTEVRDVI